MSFSLAILTQGGANSRALDSGRGLSVLLPASFLMLGALSVLTASGWSALKAAGTSRRWRDVAAFDFAMCYASSLFQERQRQCKLQDVLGIPYDESGASLPHLLCKITTHRPLVSPEVSNPLPRRTKPRPDLSLLGVEPYLPISGVLAENGEEVLPDPPLKEHYVLSSSRQPPRLRSKPAVAPIQTSRVDYNILGDGDEPIVEYDIFTPPAPPPSCDSPLPSDPALALKLTFKPSLYPSAMQRRFHNLSAILTQETIQSLAPSIHSISITIPTLSNGDLWIPQGLANPFDGRTTSANIRVDHPSVLDGCSPLRYRNLFPNLEEFVWIGPLGRRYGRGSRTTGALPAPFYDITSLPFGQLRALKLQGCAITLSDCSHILRSSPRLSVCVIDQVVDIDPCFFTESQESSLRSAIGSGSRHSGNDVPKAYPIFLPLCDPDNGAYPPHQDSSPYEPLISCPHLHTLHIRTLVDLCHFFSTLSAPALRSVKYAPIPRQGSGNGNLGAVEGSSLADVVGMVEDFTGLSSGVITIESFPWNIGWESLETFELVISDGVIMQEGVEELLDEIAKEEDVAVRIVAEGVDEELCDA